MDIVPTVLDHLGVDIQAEWGFDGTSLLETNCTAGDCAKALTATPNGNTVQLAWTPAEGVAATGYELYRDGELVATLPLAPGIRG